MANGTQHSNTTITSNATSKWSLEDICTSTAVITATHTRTITLTVTSCTERVVTETTTQQPTSSRTVNSETGELQQILIHIHIHLSLLLSEHNCAIWLLHVICFIKVLDEFKHKTSIGASLGAVFFVVIFVMVVIVVALVAFKCGRNRVRVKFIIVYHGCISVYTFILGCQ